MRTAAFVFLLFFSITSIAQQKNHIDTVVLRALVNSTDEIALLSGMWWCKRYLWKEFKWNENTSVDQVSDMVNQFKKSAIAEGLDDRRKYFKDINKFVDCD